MTSSISAMVLRNEKSGIFSMDGSLSFDGLVSDVFQVNKATEAYKVAFEKAECLKMVLDWRNAA